MFYLDVWWAWAASRRLMSMSGESADAPDARCWHSRDIPGYSEFPIPRFSLLTWTFQDYYNPGIQDMPVSFVWKNVSSSPMAFCSFCSLCHTCTELSSCQRECTEYMVGISACNLLHFPLSFSFRCGKDYMAGSPVVPPGYHSSCYF